MVVRVENSYQIAQPAIIAENDALIGYDRGTSVDEDALAQHQGTIWASANLNWDRLAAQQQASALDRSGRDEHRP
jgi:hypothetical protein